MLPLKTIRRLVIAIIGGTILFLGILMILLPGPAFLVIPAGLAILAMEFAWAKHWLKKTRKYAEAAKAQFTSDTKSQNKTK